RARSLDRFPAEQVEQLVRRLGHARQAERERAHRELVRLGKFTRERLRHAAESGDAEVARRARDCLRQIEYHQKAGVAQAAARLLIKRRQGAALEVLLKFLPEAEDEEAETELYYGLEALGVRKDRVAPAFLDALKDKAPARRAVAACIVGWRGDAAGRRAV